MAESIGILNGDCEISDNGSFVYPKDKAMTSDDLQNFVEYHNGTLKPDYVALRKEYLGQHPIFEKIRNKASLRPDNRLMANLTKYVVETFNGYFIGVPPNITLNDESDNEELQNWINSNSFADKLSEISRQCDIYGRSIAFVYQDESSNTKVTYTSPETSFIIYDDTVEMNPIAYVRYSFKDTKVNGTIYFAGYQYNFDSTYKLNDVNAEVNPFNAVPAVEFSSNIYKQGLINDIKSLNDALDNALSQKANQNEYFDNSYLLIAGLELPTDENGNVKFNLDGNQVFYAPEADASNAEVKFIEKPDGDNMQENMINRLTNLIYQISMVANLNDEAFSGNSSGVALKYKLLPMQNMAINKERKFTQSMRQLFKTIFSVDTILKNDHVDAWKDLSFKFYQNLPINTADEANTARSLEGIVSKETQLETLSFVDDPKKEIQRMADEHIDKVENAKKAAGDITDQGN